MLTIIWNWYQTIKLRWTCCWDDCLQTFRWTSEKVCLKCVCINKFQQKGACAESTTSWGIRVDLDRILDSDDSYDFHKTNCQTLAALRIPGLPQPVSPLIMLLGGKKNDPLRHTDVDVVWVRSFISQATLCCAGCRRWSSPGRKERVNFLTREVRVIDVAKSFGAWDPNFWSVLWISSIYLYLLVSTLLLGPFIKLHSHHTQVVSIHPNWVIFVSFEIRWFLSLPFSRRSASSWTPHSSLAHRPAVISAPAA